jgi:hypothetical protein
MRSLILLMLLVSLAGCHRKAPPPPPKVFERDQPNAPVTAVQTVPFDDGYKAGFDAGAADAVPKAPLPSSDAVDIKATAAAATDPDRNEKWQHGYAEGYLDGFRKVATHTR